MGRAAKEAEQTIREEVIQLLRISWKNDNRANFVLFFLLILLLLFLIFDNEEDKEDNDDEKISRQSRGRSRRDAYHCSSKMQGWIQATVRLDTRKFLNLNS